MRPMPIKLRNEMDMDEYYHRCARYDLLRDHICKPDPISGKLIEWEHAFIFAGKQINERWAIVPICWLAHRGGYMVKEINEWIALNRATDEELRKYSKAVDLIYKRNYLNKIYGENIQTDTKVQ